LTFDLKRLLVQIVALFIEITLHLSILSFEQANMLMTGLIVIVETADARLLLILKHLLLQDFEFQFHEMDLLL